MTAPKPMVVFVYGVDGGLVNDVFDTLHKVFSPGTYACNLCKLTYGLLAERQAWTQTVRDLPLPSRFLHRAEYVARYGPGLLPAVFLERDGALSTLIAHDEVQACADLDALIALVKRRVGEVASPRLHPDEHDHTRGEGERGD